MKITRRQLLGAGLRLGVGAAAVGAMPRLLFADQSTMSHEPLWSLQDTRVKELALRAIDAAVSAGATYADARLTHTKMRIFHYPSVEAIEDREHVAVGVRALLNGYWGFASSPIWSPDEMARLGREAVHQARAMAVGPSSTVHLANVPVVNDGHWTMPVEIDPFEVSPYEICDYLAALVHFVRRFPGFNVLGNSCRFLVQEKAFASSEGSYCTQRLYRSEGEFGVRFETPEEVTVIGALDVLSPAGVGWELYKGQDIRDHIRRLMEELKEDAALPTKPVEVGRYEIVCDAQSVARLADHTLGLATQLDRALGQEANASGTSFLDAPLEMVGNYEIGAPLLTLTANRTERGGAGTVAWDDEGVPADEFTLVHEGVLRDFQTTRESAGWLAEYYAQMGEPVRSHGCAAAPTAVEAPLAHTPNLRVAPGEEAGGLDGVLAGVQEGLLVKDMRVDMDFQGLSGLGMGGRVYEVKRGRRVARILGAGILFTTTELWKRLAALGGRDGLRTYGMRSSKGEPVQRTYHSVTAPPAVFEDVALVELGRRA